MPALGHGRPAPDEVGGGAFYLTGPTEDFVPAHLIGRLECAILAVYAGGKAEARRAAAPLLSLGHEGASIADMPYAELQCMLDDPPGTGTTGRRSTSTHSQMTRSRRSARAPMT